MKKKETRGRKKKKVDPVLKGQGVWLRLGEAVLVLNMSPLTVLRIAEEGGIKMKKEYGIRVFYVKKEQNE